MAEGQAVKILFLDVDGVLNTASAFERPSLHPDKLARLLAIVVETGCDVVLSSSWRAYLDSKDDLRRAMRRAGFEGGKMWIAQTPTRKDAPLKTRRAAEIAAWLARTELSVAAWVALDDDVGLSSAAQLEGHVVQVNGAVGLTDADVALAIALLLAPPLAKDCTPPPSAPL
jgi:hypothetical protein